MERWRAFISRFRNRARPHPPEDKAEELRIAFRERYRQFKSILSANNQALEVMGEIESALGGTRPFGMQFVRSRCTRVSTNVFQIVRHINALAPGRYEKLFPKFKELQTRINPFVHPPGAETKGPLVMPIAAVDHTSADLAGPKMANLAEMARRLQLAVPNGFVITSGAFETFMAAGDLQAEINRRIQAAEVERPDQLHALSAGIQQLIINAAVPPLLQDEIMAELRRIEEAGDKPARWAVRSSALGEDLAESSFAGQYRSVLNVGKESLLTAYKEVVASKYALTAMTYRLNRGIRDEDVLMCVGCLLMVEAAAGGVLYTRDPVDIRNDTLIIHSAWGLPKSVVDGTIDTDQFVIRRGVAPVIHSRRIPRKNEQYICYPEEGVCRMDVTGDRAEHPSLDDAQVLTLAEMGLRIEEYYGAPQDIEWALDAKGDFILLQCRPLQRYERPAQATADSRWPVSLRGGMTASPGVGAGPAFVVAKEADALQFPPGAVLVIAQALPRWAPLLDRAAAVVSEQGSPAGHLANVAREFAVPALFGVAGATTALQTGRMVTVDAADCKVYEGRIEPLLGHRDQPRNLMEGSPVWRLLEQAAKLIVPLNLLNPDAPEFRAENCRTLHDITRFCHEKAVHEMFRFGKAHHFPERSSKQLRAQIPMQWWVLNLDDGFKEEVEGRFVELDNIVSIPMLALWAGITAIPWEGPPPVDGKGFMSVMFQSTTNQGLLPTVRSSMGNRNYFMISKNYCSLQSRLGFHFSIVETLVGDRTSENYINYHFKGGGADLTRRLKRVLFIKELLEGHGFRIRIQQDALNARIEQQACADMIRLLKILGYISIHTRQLDMIMANPGVLNFYRTKIISDIATLAPAADLGLRSQAGPV